VIDAVAPVLSFLLSAVFGLLFFVPAWVIRRMIKVEALWIRPALWLGVCIVLVGAWGIYAMMDSDVTTIETIWTILKEALFGSAIFCVPWALIAAFRTRNAKTEGVTNG
jgi:hypothetical protein